MINLIKNELKKIFSKKTLYIILFITIGICIFVNVMNKKFETDDFDMYSESQAQMYRESLEYAKESQDIEYLVDCEGYLETQKIAIKYDKDSWQRYIVETKLQPVIYDMVRMRNTDIYNTYKEDYDKILKEIESGDWKTFVQEELDDINSELELIKNDDIDDKLQEDTIEPLRIQKQVLDWRLEKNISYGKSDLNSYLENWHSAQEQIIAFKSIQSPTYEEKIENQSNIETVNVCEYAIKNGINCNITNGGNDNLQYSLSNNANIELINVFSNFSFFILITIIIIAGTIVSDEANKGTIKLLLVRPYKRTKILLAKFITCLIILLIALVCTSTIQAIVGGIVYGFGSYGEKIAMYNFNSNSLELVGTFRYLVMSAVVLLPQYLLYIALAFTISTVLTNAPMAIAIPLLGTIGADIINSLLRFNYEKAKFLIYFVTPNWDLSMYSFGKLPTFRNLTLPFSICVCLVYFVVLLGISIRVFKRRDIKNV